MRVGRCCSGPLGSVRDLASRKTRQTIGRFLSGLQFLAELGIVEENPGYYNGAWGGSGSVANAINPATGETIATVRQATVEEYEACLAAMTAAQEAWQLVRGNAPCRRPYGSNDGLGML